MLELTDPLKRAVAEHAGRPVRLLDPETCEQYVLVPAEMFERFSAVLFDDNHPRATYPAVDRAFAEGWNDPKMDDYDRYEELKK